MKKKPVKLKLVRRTLADGTVKEYAYPRDGKAGEPKAATVGAVIVAYKRSPEFAKLADNTKATYRRQLDRIGAFHNTPVKNVRHRDVLEHRDVFMDRPGVANQIVYMWQTLLKWAKRRGYVEHNVALEAETLPLGSWKRWPEHVIELAIRPGYLSEQHRRAVVLALYTGQRAGDCIRMLWTDYDGEAIAVTQQKTGTKLWIPCHKALRGELDAWKAERDSQTVLRLANTILTNREGRPWPQKGTGFATVMGKAFKLRPEMKGLCYHGLRKAAAARLAEAGCSAKQIGAITGHKSLGQLETYVAEAEQKVLARGAITKLEDYRR